MKRSTTSYNDYIDWTQYASKAIAVRSGMFNNSYSSSSVFMFNEGQIVYYRPEDLESNELNDDSVRIKHLNNDFSFFCHKSDFQYNFVDIREHRNNKINSIIQDDGI